MGATAERMLLPHLGNARKAIRLEVYASVGDLAKSRQKKGKAEHREVHLYFLIVFDKVSKPTGWNRQRPTSQLAGQLGKNRTIRYNGDIKKTHA